MTRNQAGDSTLRQALRFLVAGGLNTGFTVLIYEIALFWVHYAVAFTISSAAGIVFTGYAYTRFVFAVPTTTRRFAANAVYYVVSWMLGLGVLDVFVRVVGIHERIALLLAIAVLAPFNFLVLRYLLQAGQPSDASGAESQQAAEPTASSE